MKELFRAVGFILMFTSVYLSPSKVDAQLNCEISFFFEEQRVLLDDTELCVQLSSKGFTDVDHFEFGLTYPTEYIKYRASPFSNLADIEIIDIDENLILITWTGASQTMADNQSLIELCFDLIDYSNSPIPLEFSSSSTIEGIVVESNEEKLLHCNVNGLFHTPCSDPFFELVHNEFEVGLNACLPENIQRVHFQYNSWLHDSIHFPIRYVKKDAATGEVLIDYTMEYRAEGEPLDTAPDTMHQAGHYFLDLTNSFGCTQTREFEIPVTNGDTIVYATELVIQNTCLGIDDGFIEIRIHGYSTAYDKMWSTGEIQEGEWLKPGRIENLTPGFYSVKALNAPCEYEKEFEIKDLTSFLAIPNSQFPSCGGQDGKIWFNPEPPEQYSYQWEGRPETTPIIENLESGIYRVTVTGPSGCERHKEIVLGSTDDIDLKADIEGGCQNTSSRRITITNADQNVTPLDFEWSTGFKEIGQESRMDSLDMGDYWVAASNACDRDTVFFTLSDGLSDPLRLDERDIEDPSCQNGNDGRILLFASGGSGEPYQYMWEDGTDTLVYSRLEVGTYRVTVTDAGGCTLIDSFTLTSSVMLEAEIDEVSSILEVCPGELGLVSIITNTNAPVFYHDQSGVNLGDEPALPVGEHVIDVFTDGGCTTQVTVEVTEQILQVSPVTSIPQTLCTGLTYPLAIQIIDNVADLQGTINGDPWDVTDTVDLSPGQYDLMISNIGGCFWDTTFTIVEGDFQPLFTDPIPVSLCDEDMYNLSIADANDLGTDVNATINGDAWDINDPQALGPGQYDVVIDISGGCSWDSTFTIDAVSFLPGQDFTISLESDALSPCAVGPVSLEVVDLGSGSNIVNIQIENDAYSVGDIIELEEGDHLVELTNDTGCTWDTLLSINQTLLEVSLPDDITLGQNETTTITAVSNFENDLTYTWSLENEYSCANAICSSIDITGTVSEVVKVEALHIDDCSATDSMLVSISIVVDQQNLFYIPNILNLSSAINNTLCVHVTPSVATIDAFILYDRWGGIVAGPLSDNSSDATCIIDESNLRSTDLRSGVYVYLLELTLVNGVKVHRTGDVTILK